MNKPVKCGDWVYFTKNDLSVQLSHVLAVHGNSVVTLMSCDTGQVLLAHPNIAFTTAKAGTVEAKMKWSWNA